MSEKHASIDFHGVDITDVDFHVGNELKDGTNVGIEIDPYKKIVDEESGFFLLVLIVKLTVKDQFVLNVRAIGKFTYTGDGGSNERDFFINRNAPVIMFPFVRSFIATLTSNVGDVMNTMVIPPQLFDSEIPELDS